MFCIFSCFKIFIEFYNSLCHILVQFQYDVENQDFFYNLKFLNNFSILKAKMVMKKFYFSDDIAIKKTF